MSPLQLSELSKVHQKENDITFLVAGDPQFDLRDDYDRHRLTTLSMNQIQKALGKDSQNRTTQGIWPAKTYYGFSTLFPEAGQRIKTPLFVVLTGDLTMSGKRAELGSFRSLYENRRTAKVSYQPSDSKLRYLVFPGLGNHDLESQYPAEYISQRMKDVRHRNYSFDPVSRNYSWDVGIFHFIQMHEYAGSAGESEIQWLREDLERASQRRKKIILIQHYGLDDFSLCSDNPYGVPEDSYTAEDCRWWTDQDVKNLEKLIQRHDVAAMFSGHWHINGHCDWLVNEQKIPAFTSGGAKDTQNFLLVRLTERHISVANIQVAGSPEAPRIYFSRFWMGSQQYDGSSHCRFLSRNPFSKKHIN